MSPTAAPTAVPSRSDVEVWDSSDLDSAAARWRTAANGLESAFEQHRQNILTPGGTTWEGDAKDAALDRVTADTSVVRLQGDVHREAADIAARGSEDIQGACSRVLEAIAEAEQDDFRVGDDLSATDNRAYDVETAAARATAATEHSEFIRWRAEQLVATDALIGQQLQVKASELEGIRFEGESDGSEPDLTIRLVDNKTDEKESQTESPERVEPGSPPEESAGTWQDMLTPAGTAETTEGDDAAKTALEALLGEDRAAEGQQPSNLDEALSEVAGQPVAAPPTALERILNQHAGSGKSEDRPYTQHPLEAPIVGADPSVIGQQARVDAAHEGVGSAQAALDDALAQSTVAGAGAGPGRDQLDALGQALFDARGEVTSQTEILENLNAAAGEVGQGRVPIPALPENAGVQAFRQEPSAFAEGSRALSEGSLGFIPDVAHDSDVFTNWSEHSVEDRVGAVLDAAGMAPIPGGKFVTEGIEHAVDAFNASRHVDDALDAASAGAHHVPDAPAAPHIDVGANHGADMPLGSSHFSDIFPPVELDIAHAAQDVYSSPAMDDIRQAAQNGVAAEVEINGFKVLYEPDIPGSGFSLASFGERGFAIGPEAMASEVELARTVAHELYRVNMTEVPELGIDATRAASETEAAFDFAQRFGNAIQGSGG